MKDTLETPIPSTKQEGNVCPNCGSMDVATTWIDDNFPYGAGSNQVQLTARVPLRSCSKCEFEYFDDEAENARHEAVCRHLGVQTPAEIQALRRKYGLSRAEFARLTGLGEATLARWESGALIQNTANDRFLYLLRWEENLKRLRELTEGHSSERKGLDEKISGTLSEEDRDRVALQETTKRETTSMTTKAKKKHFVAVPKEGGGFDLCALKDWLRQHPEDNPRKGDPSDFTSHQLRDALRKTGWTIEEVVVCFKPET
jgi:putative zinc finger/helix-turn-helix YgiT family protein